MCEISEEMCVTKIIIRSLRPIGVYIIIRNKPQSSITAYDFNYTLHRHSRGTQCSDTRSPVGVLFLALSAYKSWRRASLIPRCGRERRVADSQRNPSPLFPDKSSIPKIDTTAYIWRIASADRKHEPGLTPHSMGFKTQSIITRELYSSITHKIMLITNINRQLNPSQSDDRTTARRQP